MNITTPVIRYFEYFINELNKKYGINARFVRNAGAFGAILCYVSTVATFLTLPKHRSNAGQISTWAYDCKSSETAMPGYQFHENETEIGRPNISAIIVNSNKGELAK